MNAPTDLRDRFRQLQGRICWVGVGNAGWGDDGFGVRLARELNAAGLRDVVIADHGLEAGIATARLTDFDHVVILDAVDYSGEPGSVVWLAGREIEARFPQISTHKISLGLMTKLLEENGKTRCWLLGVQPESLQAHHELSPLVHRTLEYLKALLLDEFGPRNESCDHSGSSASGMNRTLEARAC